MLKVLLEFLPEDVVVRGGSASHNPNSQWQKFLVDFCSESCFFFISLCLLSSSDVQREEELKQKCNYRYCTYLKRRVSKACSHFTADLGSGFIYFHLLSFTFYLEVKTRLG